MNDPKTTAAPDFTTAALAMATVNLLWIFCVLWALFGFVPVLLLAALLNHAITRLHHWRNQDTSQ